MTIRLYGADMTRASTDLLSYVRSLEERAKKKHRLDITALPQPESQAHLPPWDDEMRCLSNEILRSALFNARNRQEPRRFFKNEPIAVVYGTAQIAYTGEELRQNDELVWLQLIHLSKNVPLGRPVEFAPYGMANALKLTKSNANPRYIARIFESLRRMQATALCIHSKRLGRSVSLSMIPKFEWQDETTGDRLPKWRVYLAPELVLLFEKDHITHLQWQQRLALPTGLATWMHGYFASHREPFPLRLSELKRGAGCTTKSWRRFKQMVSVALDALVDVGFLRDAEIRGEYVHVERN